MVPNTHLDPPTSPVEVDKVTFGPAQVVDSGADHQGRRKYNPQTSPCVICGQLGHWRHECPDKDKNSGARRASNDPEDDLNFM